HLDELLVLLEGAAGERLRNRGIDALAVLVQVRLHPHEIDAAADSFVSPDRELERYDTAAELLLERLHGAFEGSPLPVRAVDDQEDRPRELLGELPGLLRLHL